mmetsp:Transcript_41055/g.66039  ORF Transcript_41055/g.66039 Transcript_41055/m.66039 type:complete len:306 (+) Transcript_41055:89-1006(+)
MASTSVAAATSEDRGEQKSGHRRKSEDEKGNDTRMEARLLARCLLCLVDDSLDLPRATAYCLDARRPDLAIRLLQMLLPCTPTAYNGPIQEKSRNKAADASRVGDDAHFEAFAAAAAAETQSSSSSLSSSSSFSRDDPEVAIIIAARHAPSDADARVTRAEIFHQLVSYWLRYGCSKDVLGQIWKIRPEGYSTSSLIRVAKAVLGMPAPPLDLKSTIVRSALQHSNRSRNKDGDKSDHCHQHDGDDDDDDDEVDTDHGHVMTKAMGSNGRRVTVGELKPHLKALIKNFRHRSDRRHDDQFPRMKK